MLRRLWQSIMIALARSNRVTWFMQGNRTATSLATRYVAGEFPQSGVTLAARLLSEQNIRSSLFYLGEYVDCTELVEENCNNIMYVIDELEPREKMDMHVSVDPTQIGYSIDKARCKRIAQSVAEQIQLAAGDRDGVNCMMIDMEDHSVVDDTLNLHEQLRQQGLPVAQTLQAYLRRTTDDMRKMIDNACRVRLVKGAFVGGADIAYTRHGEIKANYRKLVEMMLSPEAREKGFYPIIATHDHHIHEFAIQTARRNGWQPGEYEFEMLLGVRRDVAQELARRGERVRLYVPFGRDWWPYAIRRIGENPSNAVLLARSLFA